MVYIHIYICVCTRSKRRVDSRSFRPLAKQTAPCPMQQCVSWFLHRSARSTLHLRTDSLTRCHWFESSAISSLFACMQMRASTPRKSRPLITTTVPRPSPVHLFRALFPNGTAQCARSLEDASLRSCCQQVPRRVNRARPDNR